MNLRRPDNLWTSNGTHAQGLDHTQQESPDYQYYLTETDSSEPLPTPPPSQSPPTTVVSVSTAFYPGSHAIGYDTIFSSSESVLFYVHSHILGEMSNNVLPRRLKRTALDPPIIPINEPAVVLDVILHILYSDDVSTRNPTFSSVIAAVDLMPVYGINPKDYLIPGNVNYNFLLSFAPLHPLELYSLAGSHDLNELAVAVSSHLLSYPLSNIDDASATRMGAIYLSRLFRLHLDRSETLKNILLIPPHPHPPTKDCNFTDQKPLARAWALVAAHLAWDATPGPSRVSSDHSYLSPARIKSAFGTLDDQIDCSECQKMLQDRLKDVVTRWACTKCTI